jgi:hypothetical protein
METPEIWKVACIDGKADMDAFTALDIVIGVLVEIGPPWIRGWRHFRVNGVGEYRGG